MVIAPFYIFLDFDGVLHDVPSSDAALFFRADRLGRVLENYPELGIIVSSSWRENYPIDELRRRCGSVLGPRLIDVTPLLSVDERAAKGRTPHIRFVEIARWFAIFDDKDRGSASIEAEVLARSDWVAIDDTSDWFPLRCAQLVHVSDGLGLSQPHLDKLEARLLACHRQQDGREVVP